MAQSASDAEADSAEGPQSKGLQIVKRRGPSMGGAANSTDSRPISIPARSGRVRSCGPRSMAVAHPMPPRDHRMSDATPRDHSFLRSSGGPRPGSIYAIVGPDGAGKTTIAMDMVSRLLRRGIRTRISWMRSPRIVTLAVIGVLRLARLAKTVRLGDHDDVHIDLRGHRVLLHLYAWSITFDYFLGYFGKVTVPRRFLRRAIICDRFAWDTLVDLGLTSGLDEGFLDMPQGQILLGLATKRGGLLG